MQKATAVQIMTKNVGEQYINTTLPAGLLKRGHRYGRKTAKYTIT